MSAKTSKPESSATKSMPPTAFDKLYWFRIGMGFLGGVVAQVVFGSNYYDGLSVGILFYLISFYAARYAWYKGLSRDAIGKVYSTGVGGFFLLFLFTWMLFFTLQAAGYSA